jgi:biopolymer transport protein ExbD
MCFEGRRRPRPGPNLTPLVDVVFLLLLFFMLTSHFVREEVIELSLPEAESGSPGDEVLQLQLAADGEIRLGELVIAPAALEHELARQLERRPEKVVRIRGDKGASLEMTVGLLDAARKAGAVSVDIVTRQP